MEFALQIKYLNEYCSSYIIDKSLVVLIFLCPIFKTFKLQNEHVASLSNNNILLSEQATRIFISRVFFPHTTLNSPFPLAR